MGMKPILIPEHVKELGRSGLTFQTVKAAGLYTSIDPAEITRILNWESRPDLDARKLGPSLVIPYMRRDGHINGFARVKPSCPRPDKKGGVVKYEQPFSVSPVCNFTKRSVAAAASPGLLIAFAEGEKKQLLIDQCGFACVGLPGVWAWQQPGTKDNRQLMDDLAAIDWQGRPVPIIFDTDELRNSHVNYAAAELARVLTDRGAVVTIISLPVVRNEAGNTVKNGADDFAVRIGLKAFTQFIELQLVPTPPPTLIGDYRAEMQRLRLQSLDEPAATWIDTSPTGSGKSYADLPAVTKAGKSLTVLPSHSNCCAVEGLYRDGGLDAVAFPKLSETTCLNLEAANRAINAGLSASAAVCPGCAFRDECSYRGSMTEADGAAHKIATHKRAQLSLSAISRGVKFLSLHEDPVGLLRPVVEFSRGLDSLITVVTDAQNSAVLDGNGSLRHFFYQMERIAVLLAERLEDANDTEPIPMTANAGHPPAVDIKLLASMIHTNCWPPADVVRAVKAAATGDLAEIVVRVDRVFRPAKAKAKAKDKAPETSIHRNIVAVWRTDVPAHAVTWINDATADRGELTTIIGGTVHDATPKGRLEMLHPILQVPVDVKQQTAPSTVAKILAGLLLKFADRQKVGIITHRCHVAVARGTAHAARLPDALASRIVRVEHFRSGESRGSNDWLESCDMLIVLGTPRVPPAAVKNRLFVLGKVMAASRDGQWEADYWSGVTLDGKRRTIKTAAYRDHDWHASHRAIVRAELIQSAGRGRGLCENGIPVVVVSNESLNFPILEAEEIKSLTKNEISGLRAVATLSEQNSKRKSENAYRNKTLNSISLEFCSDKPVSTFDLAVELNKTVRYAQKILNSLLRHGLVERIGDRGGWLLTDAGKAVCLQPGPVDEKSGAGAGEAAAGPAGEVSGNEGAAIT